MNILFLTLGAKNGLYGSLINKLVEMGHRVTTVSPTQNVSSFSQSDRLDSVCFHAMPLTGVGSVKKGIADITFSHFCLKAIKKYLPSYTPELIISTTPPLGYYKVVKYYKKRNADCKSYIILRDIWPEAFKLLDFDKRFPMLYKYYRNEEKKMYELADVIGCMSQGNIDFVKHSNPETADKLTYLPNWSTIQPIQPADESIRTKYGLEGKVVFIYGGNMSVPQGMENIISLAEIGLKYENLLFLLIGKGTEKQKVVEAVKAEQLNNVKIMDYLPQEDYQNILKSCDVGLISLNDKLQTPSIPSKIMSYWNLGIPVFAIIDHVTDYGTILDESKSGLWARVGETEKIKAALEKMVMNGDLRKQMGNNGKEYLKNECSVELTYQRIFEQLYGNKQ